LNYYTQITTSKYDKYVQNSLYILITLSLAEPNGKGKSKR